MSGKKTVVTVIVIGCLIGLFFVLKSKTNVFGTNQPATGSSYTKGETDQATKNATTQSNTKNSETKSEPGDQKSDMGGDASVNLTAPTGDFVSNHHPNLDGDPAPSAITSVCTTTPGAKCQITFTKDGITKSLPNETTDRGGSAYWNWKLSDIGLSTGMWQVKAIATLGSQTQSTTDALVLEVAQ